jgi:cellulose synthase (UDP-forming)
MVVMSFSGITYGFLRACFITTWFIPFFIYWMFVIATFLISSISNYVSKSFDLEAHDLLVREGLPHYPSVDVWLPVCGEPLSVMRNTWCHVALLEYPGPITVYVLDDEGSLEDGVISPVELMALEFGFEYLSRPNKGWMKKSGNLRHAYNHSSGEFVALFDADFCPRSDFLTELMPYFEKDPRSAIVQSSQYFRYDTRQHWIERGASEVQEFFYRMIQVSRSQKSAGVCCGTNAIYRRAALEENGGMTMVPQGEDMRTGFDLTCLGWKVTYVPLNLAMGLNPADMSSFFKQQYRWCSGSLAIVFDQRFWTKSISLESMLCYIAGFSYYVETAVFMLVMPVFTIAMLVFYPQHFKVIYYDVIGPSLAIMLIVYPLWHRCRYGLAAWGIRIAQQWTYIFAITDFINGSTIPWDATGSTVKAVSASKRFYNFRLSLLIWNGGMTTAWLTLAVWRSLAGNWVNFAFVSILGGLWTLMSWRVIFTAYLWTDPPRPGQIKTFEWEHNG